MGPTGSGKSGWALEQAIKYNGSVVNIDSVQFYENLIVGSAAPTIEEKKLAPHHLYSYVKAPLEMTAGLYLKDFYQLLEGPVKFPLFIVGGTGFYIQALEKGMFNVEPIPAEFRKIIEEELASLGPQKLFDELRAKDPGSKIHINDHFRLVRAIEILRFTGEIPSSLKSEQNKNEFPFPLLKVGFTFEKPEFEKRIALRTKKMIAGGIIAETEAALSQGNRDWAPLQSVGYRETVQFLEQKMDEKWLFEAICLSSMQLIKKQKTWFKRDGSVLWSKHEDGLHQFLS